VCLSYPVTQQFLERGEINLRITGSWPRSLQCTFPLCSVYSDTSSACNMNKQQQHPLSLPETLSNPHNIMEVHITEYSTFNYLNQQCRALCQKVMHFRMVGEFSPFDGIQSFTTLDYFQSQLNPIHNLLLLKFTWSVPTNAKPIHRIYNSHLQPLYCSASDDTACSEAFSPMQSCVHVGFCTMKQMTSTAAQQMILAPTLQYSGPC
jgi:hypothetical protein